MTVSPATDYVKDCCTSLLGLYGVVPSLPGISGMVVEVPDRDAQTFADILDAEGAAVRAFPHVFHRLRHQAFGMGLGVLFPYGWEEVPVDSAAEEHDRYWNGGSQMFFAVYPSMVGVEAGVFDMLIRRSGCLTK